MKIIMQLILLMLPLLLVNANQYCDNFIQQYNTFRNKCSLQSITVNNCCNLRAFSKRSGVYKLRRKTFSCIDSYCDMNATGGGWIVIQRNKWGSLVDFNKNWTEYEEGFGDLHTEFWYGLENIYHLTKNGKWEMRVDFLTYRNFPSNYTYQHFSVGKASDKYPLSIGGYIGTDGNQYHTGMKFSTPDNDNDISSINCAAKHMTGWWYSNCYSTNPNTQPPDEGTHGSVKLIEIKIRPKDCIMQ